MYYCSDCKTHKDPENFSKNKSKKTGFHNICKPCSNNRKAMYNIEYPEKRRQSQIKYDFGISWEMYELKFKSQNGCCAICATPLKLHKGIDSDFDVACVDHNHQTGEVRGLLCTDCNLGLGKFKDSLTFIQSASEYLVQYGSIKTS